MTAIHVASPFNLAQVYEGQTYSLHPKFWRLLALSLALHAGFLLLLEGVRLFPSRRESPIVHEISLVRLPNSVPATTRTSRGRAVKKAARQPVPPKGSTQPSGPVTASHSLSVPPVPMLGPEVPETQARSRVDVGKVVGGIELSPPVSKTPAPADMKSKPGPTVEQLRRDVQSIMSKLHVPQVSVPGTTLQRPELPTLLRPKPHPSLAEGIKSELAKIDTVLEARASVTHKWTPQPPPVLDSPQPQHQQAEAEKAPVTLQNPSTKIHVSGGSSDSDRYLARVQASISRHWLAPPVDFSGESLVVVVKFRLSRNGGVSRVTVEQTSGNQYYDVAGKRAVLASDPLPPFPRSLRAAFFDTHFTFLVGGKTG